MVIPRFVESAVKNKPIEIFGDGTQTRVFCHVKDSVGAVISLAQSENTIGEVFNVGGIQEISILELANLIIQLTDSKSKVNFTAYNDAYPLGFEDMKKRVPDISKIKKFTDWEPKLNLEKIISDVVNYIT
jgi:UDP-glucose 4-epimerase